MPLSDDEKQRVRYHLGYPALTTAASLEFGVPALNATNFLVDSALNRLLETSLDRLRCIVQVLDGIEDKLVAAQLRLAASRLEDIELREDEPDRLEREYRRWGYRLSNLIGAPVYPFAERYRQTGPLAVTTVPIMRS